MAAETAVAKPKRRFAPQLMEQTIKSSSNRKQQQEPPFDRHTDHNTDADTHNNSANNKNAQPALIPSRSISNATRQTRDASVQVSDTNNMADAPRPPAKPMWRFAPVPIETTFDSYRVANKNPHGPAPEPTPDPSPTTSQLSFTLSSTGAPIASETTQTTEQEKKTKRRFAPQLIETTRRVRRAGQEGPATKPIDKTDITPGTNHIYAPKPKRKQGACRPNHNSTGVAHAATEGDDEASPRFLGPRRQRSMKPHPNTRRATRNNSYHPELDTILSSESGNSSENNGDDNNVAAPALNLGAPADHGDTWSTRNSDLRNRRESCDEEFSGYLLGVAAREAHRQREFEQALSAFPNGMPPQGIEHFFVRDNSEDDLQLGDDEPPLRHGPSQLLRRKSTDPGWAVKEMRAHAEKLAQMRAETDFSFDDNSDQFEIAPPPEDPLWTTAVRRESRDSNMATSMSPFLSAHSPGLPARSPLVQDKPFAPLPLPSTGLRASPFGMPFAFHASEPEDRELRKMRKAASPPMLGADLAFRSCPSPRYTRMEPYQPYAHFDRLEERQRDISGATGLWRGYCSSKTNKLDTPALQPPPLLHTPSAYSPIDPFASSFAASLTASGTQSPIVTSCDKWIGLHKQTLLGLDERLKKEMERKEREEALLAEFDDAFVTQVYNYLSLGYPATARAFDDELSKISGICVEELRKDDTLKIGKGFMRQMEIRPSSGSTDSSGTDSSGDEVVSHFAHERRSRHKPPRWKALRLYIHEWARQHPALDVDDDTGPLAWGVRARRGSWAI
ncbi:hypothetical protein HD806DRAFT_549484 [Xylariaceae sp. AK1471]|nr:hypothetical protein HD806DRAFT_549484 [Xylariaceae sp. AK1471]